MLRWLKLIAPHLSALRERIDQRHLEVVHSSVNLRDELRCISTCAAKLANKDRVSARLKALKHLRRKSFKCVRYAPYEAPKGFFVPAHEHPWLFRKQSGVETPALKNLIRLPTQCRLHIGRRRHRLLDSTIAMVGLWAVAN